MPFLIWISLTVGVFAKAESQAAERFSAYKCKASLDSDLKVVAISSIIKS